MKQRRGEMAKDGQTYTVEIKLTGKRVNLIVHCASKEQAEGLYDTIMEDANDGFVNLSIETTPLS